MAQRDYEEQPEAPDLGAAVQLENEQHLAAPAGDRDALDAGYSPPDRPYLADEDEVTARGMREGDSLDERLRRERGDDPVDADRSGRIRLAGEGAALETPDAMDGVDVGIDGGAAAAEEAAVHTIDDEDATRDLWADGDVFDPELPGGPESEDAEELPADRIDRASESGGAAAGASGRQDAGPGAWP